MILKVDIDIIMLIQISGVSALILSNNLVLPQQDDLPVFYILLLSFEWKRKKNNQLLCVTH